MPTIVSQLDHAFRAAITAAFGFTVDPLVGPAQNEKFGDYQANAAMGLAKLVTEKTGQKTNPRAVAEAIIARLDLGAMATEISIAGPGFINVRLSPAWLGEQVRRVAADPRLGIEKSSTRKPSSSIIPVRMSPSRCTWGISAAPSSAMRSPEYWNSRGMM